MESMHEAVSSGGWQFSVLEKNAHRPHPVATEFPVIARITPPTDEPVPTREAGILEWQHGSRNSGCVESIGYTTISTRIIHLPKRATWSRPTLRPSSRAGS